MAAFAERSFNLTGVGEPERLDGRRVSANLFDLLRRAADHRTHVCPQEDQPGTKVVLLNESFGNDVSVAIRRDRPRAHLKQREPTPSLACCRTACVCLRSATGATRSGCRSPSPPEEATNRGDHFLEVIAR